MALSRIWRDTATRRVLGHRLAAAALLELACAGERVADLDPRTLRQEPTRQSGPDLAQAENDVIWSAPAVWPGPERVFFLIEVQSTEERRMALRMMRYVAMHGYQLWSDHAPPLPVTVPVVFYTGERPWDASLDAAELFSDMPPKYRPHLRYKVVDLCHLEVPEGCTNVIALLAPVMRGTSETEVVRGARALYRQLVTLGDKPPEESFFELVRAQCEENWPEENWRDCSNMAELVDALEERTMTWPEKWKARYVAEGRAQGIEEEHNRAIEDGRAQRRAMLASLEKAVRARFGAGAARAFGQQFEASRQSTAAQDPEIMDAIIQCVTLSESAEQLLTGLQSIRPETA